MRAATLSASSYGPLSTLFYDADKPLADPAEVDWYAARLPRDAGPLLELMCGSGRLLVPLVERGFNVHGVDASGAMLAACEARLAAAGAKAPVFRQDVTQLNLPFRYAAAYIAMGSFQLLADPMAASAALARIRAHLVDPGLLLLDLFVPAEAARPPGAPLVELRSATLANGDKIALRSETAFDVESRIMSSANRYTHRHGSSRLAEENELLTATWYPRDEFVALLEQVGFRDVMVGDSPRGDAGLDAYSINARV